MEPPFASEYNDSNKNLQCQFAITTGSDCVYIIASETAVNIDSVATNRFLRRKTKPMYISDHNFLSNIQNSGAKVISNC